MNFEFLLAQILEQVRPFAGQGKVANYIPELGKISSDKLGIAVCIPGGQTYAAGDAYERFSIQSISKLFTLMMAYSKLGDAMWQRVGREPSGTAFNSLVQLETDQGIPRNPFINSGALVVTDILCSHYAQPDRAILGFLRQISGAGDINFNSRVSSSEAEHGARNSAMAYFMKAFGNLKQPVELVLQTYFRHCSIEMSCVELAQAALLLVNYGKVPESGTPLLTPQEIKRITSLLLTCGTYDAAGDFAFRIGLPSKSGVGGGILAIVPGKMAICVWSPALDTHGNSLAGSMALERFALQTGYSIF